MRTFAQHETGFELVHLGADVVALVDRMGQRWRPVQNYPALVKLPGWSLVPRRPGVDAGLEAILRRPQSGNLMVPVKLAGTSEGAIKGWENRRGGGEFQKQAAERTRDQEEKIAAIPPPKAWGPEGQEAMSNLKTALGDVTPRETEGASDYRRRLEEKLREVESVDDWAMPAMGPSEEEFHPEVWELLERSAARHPQYDEEFGPVEKQLLSGRVSEAVDLDNPIGINQWGGPEDWGKDSAKVAEAQSEAGVDLDGYKIHVKEDPEKPGKFKATVNGTNYSGTDGKATPGKALAAGVKVVKVRKDVDAKRREREGGSTDAEARQADRYFKEVAKRGF